MNSQHSYNIGGNNVSVDRSKRVHTISPQAKRVSVLSGLLSKTYVLTLKTYSFELNSLPKEDQYFMEKNLENYDELNKVVQQISEHIRQMGYWVPDNFGQIMRFSEIEYEFSNPVKVLSELLLQHEQIIHNIEVIFKDKTLILDEATVKLLNTRRKKHQKNVWAYQNILVEMKQ